MVVAYPPFGGCSISTNLQLLNQGREPTESKPMTKQFFFAIAAVALVGCSSQPSNRAPIGSDLDTLGMKAASRHFREGASAMELATHALSNGQHAPCPYLLQAVDSYSKAAAITKDPSDIERVKQHQQFAKKACVL